MYFLKYILTKLDVYMVVCQILSPLYVCGSWFTCINHFIGLCTSGIDILLSLLVLLSVLIFEDDTDVMFTMEEGIFEDAFRDPQTDYVAQDVPNKYSRLVPEEWKLLQEELGKTKRQKKGDTFDMFEGRAKKKFGGGCFVKSNRVVVRLLGKGFFLGFSLVTLAVV